MKGKRRNREDTDSSLSRKTDFPRPFGERNFAELSLTKDMLVGFSGKVTKKTLRPLRRSRSDKLRDAQMEQDFQEKCYRLENRIKYHKNLLQRMEEITASYCTNQDIIDNDFYKELQEMREESRKCLLFLLEGSVPALPKDIQEMLDKLLKEDRTLQEVVASKHLSQLGCSQTLDVPSAQISSKPKSDKLAACRTSEESRKKRKTKQISVAHTAANSQYDDVKVSSLRQWQVFVHSSLKPALMTLKVNPNEPGKALLKEVKKLFPNIAPCILLYRGQKVDLDLSIAEQGIQNEANIDLHFSLRGGVNEGEVEKNKDSSSLENKAPTTWNKVQVAAWVDKVCETYEIEEVDVKKLKRQNGAGLNLLSKEDWIQRSPNQGDFFYNRWIELVKRQVNVVPPSAVVEKQPSTVNVNTEKRAEEDKKRANEKTAEDFKEAELRSTSLPGPFGIVDDLSCVDNDAHSIEDLTHLQPSMGDIVLVKGLCSSRPQNRGSAGSVLLRNDPPPNGNFLELKIDIRANSSSTMLTKQMIITFLNLKLGEPVLVRGRVESLDQSFTSKKKSFLVLPFKLVVDNDSHAAVRKDKNEKPSFSRQMSTPWPIACGIFPAELSTNQPLFKGDVLEPEYGVLWCSETKEMDEIKEKAVALKNCVTGDIYIGVSETGEVHGISRSRNKLIEERESFAKAIGGILPTVDCDVVVCDSAEKANELTERGKTFVAIMWLPDEQRDHNLEMLDDEMVDIVVRIHVTKGDARRVHFTKQSDTHAFKRVGTETKLVNDYEELFHDLESLASRNIPSKPESSNHREVTEGIKDENKLRMFQKMPKRYETDTQEFKVIYGDPTKTILKRYVAEYTASFLNSNGGSIYFGVDEDPRSKQGYVVGVVLTAKQREELLKASYNIIWKFWPPVANEWFTVEFTRLECDVEKCAVKFPKTYTDCNGKFVGIANTSGQIATVLSRIRTKFGKKAVFLRLSENRFALLLESTVNVNIEELLACLKSESESKSKKTKPFDIEIIDPSSLKDSLTSLCVMCIKAIDSPYPIHLTQPLTTYCVTKSGNIREMTSDELLERFKTAQKDFDFEKFLQSMNGLEKENSSYMLISSPHNLSREECDLYGLVIPEWFLVIDFDQNPKENGHLFDIFKQHHDKHQPERNLFMKTPLDRKIELNPSNGVCWCAVRGFEEIAASMSEGDHAVWMMKHGKKIRNHLSDELVPQIIPNGLVILCLWSEGHEDLIHSLYYLLEHIFSLWGPTRVVFVCSNENTKDVLSTGLIKGFSEAGYGEKVSRDNVFVALPQQLSRYFADKMSAPYRSENAFQIPKKCYFKEGERTISETLPQNLRQVFKGQLEFMYHGKFNISNADKDKARDELYSGSEIQSEGLASGIAIDRDKMKELKKEIKGFLSDRKCHLSMIVVKAERGAGATTLCLQLLYDYHKHFPCARLLEFHSSLITNIEKVNSLTKLPLILFVDAELAVLQEFADFKSEAERRKMNLMLIVVESDVVLPSSTPRKQGKPPKFTPTPYLAGSAPYKTVNLRRELSVEEVSLLVEQLMKISSVSESTRHKLHDLEKRARSDNSLRKFALFSLTVFGRKFTGLQQYVSYRLNQAGEVHIQILELLALIHIYTDYLFPVNALARNLNKKTVVLESIFINDDVRELLSPRSKDKNERRISFLEVAEEILKQRAKVLEMYYPKYLKTVGVRVAETALAVSQPSKLLDRITRRLYVTSEYSSEKFSPLVRCIKEEDAEAARDMLLDLCNVFEKESSVWAHLMAHLAKYYMTIFRDFDNAIPRIEEAVREHSEDSLLHHIHGDIIRLHIKNMKDQEVFSMDDILSFAIQSSACFQIVREKRPLMEYGYTSDALVRRDVMLAAIKENGKEHYVDCLKEYLERLTRAKDLEELHINYKFLFSLIPDAFENLTAVPMNEHTEQLKKKLLENIGNLEELEAFCEELKQSMKGSTSEHWIDEAVRKTTTLVYALEMETKDLKPEEADEKIARMEELSKQTNDEQTMKLWIRYVRMGSKAPDLKTLRLKIDSWLKETKRKSANALFYNYVVAVLEALRDQKDTEKMKKACKCIDEMRGKKHFKWKGTSEDTTLPIEWLHPKSGRHINSIDSLLLHEDLVRGFHKSLNSDKQMKDRKEIIEKALFEEKITKWEGTVSEIGGDWKGFICFKKYINIPFVPLNVIPGMPSQGDTVHFCLAFQRNGPMAWSVVCRRDVAKVIKADLLKLTVAHQAEQNESSDSNDEDDLHDLQPLVGEPLHRQKFCHVSGTRKERVWEDYLGAEKQGIVDGIVESRGFGMIIHPVIADKLFFHAKQFYPPIDNISTIRRNTVLLFTVDKTTQGIRARNIEILDERGDSGIDQELLDYLKEHNEQHQSTSTDAKQSKTESNTLLGSRQEGFVESLYFQPNNLMWGFIRVPTLENVTVHFHERFAGIDKKDVGKIKKGTKVQFKIIAGKKGKGYTAQDLYIQCENRNSCTCGWEEFVGKGIQEGCLFDLKNGYGFITALNPCERPKRLFFHQSVLRNVAFSQLSKGQTVHFQVVSGERGCNAADVDVIQTSTNFQQREFDQWSLMSRNGPYPIPQTYNPYSTLGIPQERWSIPRPQLPPNTESWKTVNRRKR